MSNPLSKRKSIKITLYPPHNPSNTISNPKTQINSTETNLRHFSSIYTHLASNNDKHTYIKRKQLSFKNIPKQYQSEINKIIFIQKWYKKHYNNLKTKHKKQLSIIKEKKIRISSLSSRNNLISRNNSYNANNNDINDTTMSHCKVQTTLSNMNTINNMNHKIQNGNHNNMNSNSYLQHIRSITIQNTESNNNKQKGMISEINIKINNDIKKELFKQQNIPVQIKNVSTKKGMIYKKRPSSIGSYHKDKSQYEIINNSLSFKSDIYSNAVINNKYLNLLPINVNLKTHSDLKILHSRYVCDIFSKEHEMKLNDTINYSLKPSIKLNNNDSIVQQSDVENTKKKNHSSLNSSLLNCSYHNNYVKSKQTNDIKLSKCKSIYVKKKNRLNSCENIIVNNVNTNDNTNPIQNTNGNKIKLMRSRSRECSTIFDGNEGKHNKKVLISLFTKIEDKSKDSGFLDKDDMWKRSLGTGRSPRNKTKEIEQQIDNDNVLSVNNNNYQQINSNLYANICSNNKYKSKMIGNYIINDINENETYLKFNDNGNSKQPNLKQMCIINNDNEIKETKLINNITKLCKCEHFENQLNNVCFNSKILNSTFPYLEYEKENEIILNNNNTLTNYTKYPSITQKQLHTILNTNPIEIHNKQAYSLFNLNTSIIPSIPENEITDIIKPLHNNILQNTSTEIQIYNITALEPSCPKPFYKTQISSINTSPIISTPLKKQNPHFSPSNSTFSNNHNFSSTTATETKSSKFNSLTNTISKFSVHNSYNNSSSQITSSFDCSEFTHIDETQISNDEISTSPLNIIQIKPHSNHRKYFIYGKKFWRFYQNVLSAHIKVLNEKIIVTYDREEYPDVLMQNTIVYKPIKKERPIYNVLPIEIVNKPKIQRCIRIYKKEVGNERKEGDNVLLIEREISGKGKEEEIKLGNFICNLGRKPRKKRVMFTKRSMKFA